MEIKLNIDSAQLVRRLKNGERRFAYAVVNAINNTAKRIQQAERERLERTFTIRKRDFMLRQAAVIKPFASVSQRRPYADVSVGQKPRLLLSIFERGGERKPATPSARFVAVPVRGGPARPDFRKPVTPALYMRRLKFGRTKTGKRRAGVERTKTYLVPQLGIFQRLGQTARPVYLFVKGRRLKASLHWVQTAHKVANRWFKEEVKREVVKALARSGGD